MNKLILFLLLVSTTLGSAAQKQYFIYLQSHNGEPFRVGMNEKVFTSTANGYLILSRLPDTTIRLTIGFLYERAPEQVYTVHMNRRDRGFMIRHFGEKGWGLSDLQDQTIQYSSGGNKTAGSGKASVINTSQFAAILAKASDDPSLREIVQREKQQQKEEVVKVEKQKQQQQQKEIEQQAEEQKEGKLIVAGKQPETANVGRDESLAEKAKEKPAPVEKQPETSNVVRDESLAEKAKEKPAPVEKQPETANVVRDESLAEKAKEKPAPVEKQPETAKAVREESITEKVKEKPAPVEKPYQRSEVTKRSESSTAQGVGVVYIDAYADGKKDTVSIVIPENKPVVAAVKEEPREEKKFLDISSEKKPADTVRAAAATGLVNKCNYVANNNDFYKLRKDMAAAEGDEAMITLAKKYFKLKCYTVAQVKSLGSLFLEDEGKYQFYDAVYRHTTDPANFGTLESELKDTYYINRFKAMLRN